jgi:hypothetical protein
MKFLQFWTRDLEVGEKPAFLCGRNLCGFVQEFIHAVDPRRHGGMGLIA